MEKRPVIVCTDHNLDLLRATTHAKTQEFLEVISENGFLCTISKPTRITNSLATLIDNIFVSKEFSVGYKSWILLHDISDHMPCFISLPRVEIDQIHSVEILKRKIDQKSMNCIKTDMLSIDWLLELEKMNCEDSFSHFHDKLKASLDKHCPEKRSLKRGKKSVQPWITMGLKKCISKQKLLYKHFVKNRTNKVIEDNYKKYRQCLQRTLRYSKNNYYSKLCIKHKSNTKKLWGIINSILKKSNDKTSVIDCLENTEQRMKPFDVQLCT